MCPEKPDKGRCRLEMKLVGDLMDGQVGCHDIPFGTDEDGFVDPVLGGMIRHGFDDRGQILRRHTELVCIIGDTFPGLA